MFEILGGISVLCILILLSGLKIVKEHDRLVVYRLGKVRDSKGPGMQMVIPLIDRVHTIDMRTNTVPLPALEAITRENCRIKVSALCMMQIVDPVRAVTQIVEPEKAIVEAAQLVLTAVVHQHTVKELLHDRQLIARILRGEMAKRTKHWGIRVKSIELKELELPVNVEGTEISEKTQLTPEMRNNNNNNNNASGDLDSHSPYQYHNENYKN